MKSSTSEARPILIDSCVLIAYFRKDETQHQIATDFINGLEKFFVNDYVISEVMTVLQLRESRETMKKAVEVLSRNKHVQILRLTWEEFAQTVDFMQKSSEEISFVDCSLLILGRSRELLVGTFDKALIATGKDVDMLDIENY
jgi:predicted nucleic acid-binding protein